MAQAIKYQSTTVDPQTSALQIQQLVLKYGCTRCELRWTPSGEVVAVRFAMVHGQDEIPVYLEARTGEVAKILRRKTGLRERTIQKQASRIAWRQLKDFVEQCLLAVHTGLFPIHEVFMAHVETTDPFTQEPTTWGRVLVEHGSSTPAGFLLAPPVVEAEWEDG